MVATVIHKEEISEVLEVNGQKKLDLKIDNSGSVQLSKSASGLKADVQLPAPVDISGLEAKVTDLETAKGELERKVTALEGRDDIKLRDAVLDGTSLKLTTTDGVEIVVDVASLVPPAKTTEQLVDEVLADATAKAKLVEALKDAIKGEEVQDLAGTSKGFLISA